MAHCYMIPEYGMLAYETDECVVFRMRTLVCRWVEVYTVCYICKYIYTRTFALYPYIVLVVRHRQLRLIKNIDPSITK
jgi:hypothetical protein